MRFVGISQPNLYIIIMPHTVFTSRPIELTSPNDVSDNAISRVTRRYAAVDALIYADHCPYTCGRIHFTTPPDFIAIRSCELLDKSRQFE